ncbi:MAG TPA: methionyl-tRNA formyltransferase [Pyrinomonadaceae bacterium]|nr:methionyl-tRNA formyltransferase [Pyrinomonadaceae bacterium]
MRIVFMGTPVAAVPALRRLLNDGHEVVAIYTQPDRPSGRGNKIALSPVKEFAIANDLNVFQPTKIRTPEVLEEFRSHHADVVVVVAYGRILPETFLTAFPKGAINVHFSLLPKYRGAAPVNWAIVNGEKTSGVTTMQMDAGLDTGDILLQSETAIGDDETAGELMSRLASMGANLISDTLDRIAALVPRKQNESEATLAPIMKKADGLIDWSGDATSISNRVRGFQPFPTAFSYLDGKKVTIWKSRPAHHEESGQAFGEIVIARGDSLIVSCGNNTFLQIDELQLEGKRRVSSRDFINGVKPVVGDKFGNE